MKTKIFFACLVFCFARQANAQIEFAPVGAEWYYTYADGCCQKDYFSYIISEKDTVVERNNCRVLRQYWQHMFENTTSEKYIIKQEQGKVFYYYQDQFNLLLDFDAKVGDIVTFTFMYRHIEHHIFPAPPIKYTILSVRYQVEDITIDDQNLKTFTTKGIDDIHYGEFYRPPDIYIYTEKIGLYSVFMPMFDNMGHPDIKLYRWLRCYSDADLSFISDKWAATSLPCNHSVITGINTPKDGHSIIYLNPFNDHVFVVIKDEGKIEFIDALGKVVYHSELSSGTNEISTNHFPKGIYFVKIRNKDNSIQTFKIVKS